MNKIFKVIYNKATGRYEVASELAKAEGKASSSTLQNKSIFSKRVSRLTVLSLCLASVGFAAAADNSYINVNGENAGRNEAFFQKMGANGTTPDNLSLNYEGKATPEGNIGKAYDNKTESGAVGNRSIASGVYANSLAQDSIAIGTGANVNNFWGSQRKEAVAGIAIGKHAQVEGSAGAIAFGRGSTILRNLSYNVGADNSIAIGNDSKITAASGAIAIGNEANITAINTGRGNGATNAVAIGNKATAGDQNSVALGNSTTVKQENSVAIGNKATVENKNSVALGNSTTVKRENSVAIGTETTVERENSIAIGQKASAKLERTVVIGAYATAESDRAIAIGAEATAEAGASKSIVIGGLGDAKDSSGQFKKAKASAEQAIVIGNSAQATNTASYSVTLGNSATTEGQAGISIGDRANVVSGAENAIALGQSATAAKSGDIAIGHKSQTSDAHTVTSQTIGNMSLDKGKEATANGTVSFGTSEIRRQIQNVGAGEISKDSSDVVTGSQLYHVIKAADEIAKTEYKFTVGNSNVRVMGNKNLSATNNTSNTLNFAAADGLDVEGANGTVTYKLNADSKQAISDAKAAARTVTDKLSEINRSVQDAKTAATNAATSATAAGKAKDAAVAAQGKAETAQGKAETARDEAVAA
ncbi:ESPR-type extended signal peptide-containing protein, partial [Neisseria cinerea]|uniref:ESPR-type extended signal peptide-containing protein n=1 Tax=Neisseria cinerea TaxID=483 RepID=UPI0027DFD7CA